jgi:RsiW-degrading membrane proteinase PrsW (M82 family)
MANNMNMPPIPRDHDEASFSEIVPLRSTKIKLWKSPILVFAVATAIIGVLLFFQFIEYSQIDEAFRKARAQGDRQLAQQLVMALVETYTGMIRAIAAYLLLAVLVVILIYTRSDRNILYYGFPILIVTVIFLTPLQHLYFLVFRLSIPGATEPSFIEKLTQSDNFFGAFIGMFFAAGMCEEMWKATPALIGAALTLYAAKLRPHLPAKVFDFLRVRGPLDAMLMGVAGGATFIFWETTVQYVMNQVGQAAQRGDLGAAFGTGLMLLMPRVIGGIAGHMGYSAIFGYFIGLAVIRPKHKWKLLLIGYLSASLLHALWNSVAHIWLPLWYVVAFATVLLLVACLLKARQLEATIFGRGADTHGSIVVGAPGSGYVPPPATPPQYGAPSPQYGAPSPQWGAPAPQRAAPPAQWGAGASAPQWGGPAGAPGGQAAGPPVAFPGGPSPAPSFTQASPPSPQPGFPPASQPPAAAMPQPGVGLALAVAGTSIPLMPGARVDLGMIPALGERGRGVVGEVSVHPRNPGVIGLKNLSAATWYARLRDGSVQPVEPQRNVRLAGGTSIDFGGGIQGTVVG